MVPIDRLKFLRDVPVPPIDFPLSPINPPELPTDLPEPSIYFLEPPMDLPEPPMVSWRLKEVILGLMEFVWGRRESGLGSGRYVGISGRLIGG